MRAVDVLGFAGGFTLGTVQAGFTLVGKREMKGGFGVKNCEVNRHLLGNEWQSEARDPVGWTVPDDVQYVFGNPPCSGFSVMSAKEFRGADSKINHCMWSFAEYVAKARPLVAVFESVQQAHNREDGLALMRDLRALVEDRTGLRYTLHHVLHNAYSVGGCSIRPRYFWVISQVPFGIEEPVMDEYPMLADVLWDLSGSPLQWQPQRYGLPAATTWVMPRISPTGTFDGHVTVDTPLTNRLKDLMNATEWLEGEHVAQVARKHYETHGKLPLSWAGSETNIIKNNFHMGFTTPVRWRRDTPARVITGGGPIMAIHPWLDRTMTHREIARIMGFTDNWLIEPLKGTPGLTMTWGKGITVDCGRWISGWVKRAIEGTPGSDPGKLVGDREYELDVTHTWKHHASWYSKKVAPKLKTLTPVRRSIMSETEATAAVETKESRATKLAARDEQVFELLGAGSKTRTAVSEATGLSVAEAYLSLDRLRKAERVGSERRNGKAVWFRPGVADPEPEPEPATV